MGDTVEINVVLEGVGININGCELEADLIPQLRVKSGYREQILEA